MVVMVGKSITSGKIVWRSASPTGGFEVTATISVITIIRIPSPISDRSSSRPARFDRNTPMASRAEIAPPILGSRPNMAFIPRPAPAMLPTLKARPPTITSTASR